MTTEELQSRYPKLFERLEDKDVLMRHLVVVDENEKDVTDDDIMEELYDPEIHSHVAFLHAPVIEAAGEKLAAIPAQIEQRDDVTECYNSEGDLWGLVTELSTEKIAHIILDEIENVLD